MTWNVHSHGEVDDRYKQEALAEFLLQKKPRTVALQEVCQTMQAPLAEPPLGFYLPKREIPLREDNFLLGLFHRLSGEYRAIWLPVKVGYGVRDEGVALLTRFAPREIREICLTPYRAYGDWRRRGALAALDPLRGEWTVSLHTSWWEEGFLLEWNRLMAELQGEESVWVMGDFNVSGRKTEQEGDPLLAAGFTDAFSAAEEKGEADTVSPLADGWRERSRESELRIDRVLFRSPEKKRILRYKRIFDGGEEPILSDHFGVWVESEEAYDGNET